MSKATVSKEGAILLGKYVAVDGHFDNRILRVVTHAHSDHTIRLRESLKKMELVIATPITLDILKTMGLCPRKYAKKCLSLDYNLTINVEGERITLKEAEHIPGSAQVLVEDEEGYRVAYTGDFKNPGRGTPIIRDLDVLVIESTYGRPEWTRPFKYEVEYLFVDLVKDLLVQGPLLIYGFHGKIQEVMLLLRSNGIDTPFIASPMVYKITKAIIRHGYFIENVFNIQSLEAKEIIRDRWFIGFFHANSNSRVENYGIRKYNKIILTGWEFREPYRRVDYRTWIVALSDHADFEQLLEYVRESNPKIVVVDTYRQGAGETFAKEIRRRLGIPAIPRPYGSNNMPLPF